MIDEVDTSGPLSTFFSFAVQTAICLLPGGGNEFLSFFFFLLLDVSARPSYVFLRCSFSITPKHSEHCSVVDWGLI
jgi:hypothetical protein